MDSNTTLSSSAEGSSTDRNTRCAKRKRSGGSHQENLPPGDPANENVVEKHIGTGNIEGQEGPSLSWLNDLKSHKQHRPDPQDDDDVEYADQNEEIETGAPDTLRAKSMRISKQSNPAKLTQEAM